MIIIVTIISKIYKKINNINNYLRNKNLNYKKRKLIIARLKEIFLQKMINNLTLVNNTIHWFKIDYKINKIKNCKNIFKMLIV